MPSSTTSTAPSACPGLGLKRGLAEDLVVAPYASVMALMVEPAAPPARTCSAWRAEGLWPALRLLRGHRLHPVALPRGQSVVGRAVVHGPPPGHEPAGLAWLLLDADAAPLRLTACSRRPMLLLQERIPKARRYSPHHQPSVRAASASWDPRRDADARLQHARTRPPEVQLLSNGRYHVMVTNAGGGYSRWRDLAVTRWRRTHLRRWGSVLLPARRETGELLVGATSRRWKPPTSTRRSSPRAGPSSAAATTARGRDTEIVVSPEDDIELRRVRLTNRARTRRRSS
jgi:cyclic beta-1,2-glucan synthetase